MKRVLLYILQYSIKKVIGSELELVLSENANIIDVINEADKRISSRGKFPSERYHSLLHWVYNPVTERFYKQASIIAYSKPGEFLNVRDSPKRTLPDSVIIHITPEGPCITEVEDVIDYEVFNKAIKNKSPAG